MQTCKRATLDRGTNGWWNAAGSRMRHPPAYTLAWISQVPDLPAPHGIPPPVPFQRIPLLVRSIWGARSEVVVGALRQRQADAARRLIREWEEAEVSTLVARLPVSFATSS